MRCISFRSSMVLDSRFGLDLTIRSAWCIPGSQGFDLGSLGIAGSGSLRLAFPGFQA